LPSALALALGKAGNSVFQKFPTLPSVRAKTLSKDFFKKIKKIFAECQPRRALGKENTKKIKRSLPSTSMIGR
jgi:hypothetical protein